MPTTRWMRTLRQYSAQRLVWSPSRSDPGLEHAFLGVPLDYANPEGRRISIAVSRRVASDPARRRGVLLLLNGGPGGDGGLGCLLPARLAHTPLAEVYDLIGFDPRGTGASTRLDGEATATSAAFDSRPPDSAFAAIAADMRERDLGCQRVGGDLRPHVTTRNNARDMDVIRAVLGERKINFLGYAYGTHVGAVYATLFPRRLDRWVLDSAVNPKWDWRRRFMSQAFATRENVEQWASWVGRRHGHFELGRSGCEVMGNVEGVAASLARQSADTGLRTAFDGVVGTLAAERPRWDELGYLVRELRKAGDEDDLDSAASLLGTRTAWRPGDAPGGLREAVLEAVTCETPWPTDLEVYFRDMRVFRERYPYGYGVMRAQPWVGTFRTFRPSERPVRIRRRLGYPPGLVVVADGDRFSHPSGGPAMATRLRSPLVTVVDSGDHEMYGFSGNAAVDQHVNRYLVDGVLPPRWITCPGEPRPNVPSDSLLLTA